jgi:HK97 family phage major capsid protein
LQHGINDVEYLYPEDHNLNAPPEFIKRDDSWVSRVMNSVHHTPFSRVKSLFADLTEDEARAKGYIKGKMKKEEFFGVLKRTTTPTTVYKKQKMDRDDVVDIVDFDVIAWLKSEMKIMLNEELARAFLIGDGRDASSDDKINEQNIRPIWTDSDLFTIKATVETSADATADAKAKAFIHTAVKARKNYKGSGTPALFTTEDELTDMMLMEDATGRVIYDSMDKLKNALRVSDIITVPVMENQVRKDKDTGKAYKLRGIIVNLNDYNVGADKGGAVSMFDDFDIDYNQQKYLIETRCSGALIKPYSAIVLEEETTVTTESEDI